MHFIVFMLFSTLWGAWMLRIPSQRAHSHHSRLLASPRLVDAISTSALSPDTLHALLTANEPLLLRGCFDLNEEQWCSALVHRLGDELVEYDCQSTATGLVSSYQCTMVDYLQHVSCSDHVEAVYLMSESLLESCCELTKPLQLTSIFESNLFQCFPEPIQPKHALVIGGEGARSFLHRDPYDWLGWNHLMEGRKLWMFLPPEAGECLQARPHLTDAWQLDEYPLAMGQVSDIDLFKYRLPVALGTDQHSSLPEGLGSAFAAATPAVQKRYADVPLFGPSQSLSAIDTELRLVVQEEGETVFIPAGCWHQVYHLQPSIAVASQHLHSANLERVLRHMLTCCVRGDDVTGMLKAIQEEHSDHSEVIQRTIELALKGRFGEQLGDEKYRKLFHK